MIKIISNKFTTGGLVCNDNNGSLESRETSREVRHARWEILCREYEVRDNFMK